MGTRLLQIVAFVNVPAAGTVALPHDININGIAEKPDFVAADAAGFSITANAAQVSVTNNNAAPANVNVWLELKHSIPRELGGRVQNLTPQPFIASGGGSSGGGGASAGSTGAGTIGSPLKSVFGSFQPSAGSQYFDDLVTESNITKAMDAGGVTSIQRLDGIPGVGGERILVQGVDGTWGTVVFGQQNGASQGGGYVLYALSQLTTGIFETRHSSNEGAPQNGDDWTELIGIAQIDSPTTTNAQVAGAYFHMNFNRYGNGNWQCVASDGGGGVTVVDTGIAGDFQWHHFAITWDLATTTLKYYINGVLVGTINGAAILGSLSGNFMISIGNTTAGQSDQRVVQMDWFYGFVEISR